jgi:hypothetical protein
MSTCPHSHECGFHNAVAPSIIQRVRHASAFVYCRGGKHESCALGVLLADGAEVPLNLMPDGSMGRWDEGELAARSRRFMVIEDSPVFAQLASATIASHYDGAEVVRHLSFGDAERDLAEGEYTAVVCGFGLGDGRTAHDVREVTDAPMVVLTGRLDGVEAPSRAFVVEKSAGPQALVAALRACLA